MTDWTVSELEEWDKKIVEIATNYGLDWFEIDYEVCDYYDMIGNMSYVGMPSHYRHWSYGKSFEKTHQMYNKGLEGLPYEMIINSDPSIAYLMRENPLPMHILTMAHCVGHSDFFKNNVTFSHTRPETVVARFKNAASRVDSYVKDPSIGVEKVERILDAAQALAYQCNHHLNVKKLTQEELQKKYLRKIQDDESGAYKDFDITAIPLEPDYDVLEFIRDNGRHLEDWEKDLITIVAEETKYFIPQARTKIMNEGWASFWHYKIMNDLPLSQDHHLFFIRSHNQVLRPHTGGLNPYHLGFSIFKKIEETKGLDECFRARECHNDESFIRMYLDEELCQELNLFSFSLKKFKSPQGKRSYKYTVDEISDTESWKDVRETLVQNVAMNNVPKVFVEKIEKADNTLILRHDFDGRELDLDYAEKVHEHLQTLWGDPVKFFTMLEDEVYEF
jgi:stage V sporulation protein R